jgi:hypothetical protein
MSLMTFPLALGMQDGRDALDALGQVSEFRTASVLHGGEGLEALS